uniref:Uncharacterized protein n=1 Tax=Avena sativa TaxID=4498 RepID=A0ACD5Y9M0_AVESA
MAEVIAIAVGTEVAKAVAKKAVIATLGYVWKLIKYEWCLQDSVKQGLRTLADELNYMHVCIGDVSSEGPQDQMNPVDKIWLTNVMELSSAIDIGLQSFVSRIESTKGTLLSSARRQYINHDIDSFIKEKMTKAKEVSEQRGRYGFGSSQTTTTSTQKVDPRLLALFRKESELVGLEEETNKLIKILSNRDHVSIVGMGGMGKTTLARAVYGKLAMSGNFDCTAFVPAGQHANVDKVLMDILEDLHIDIYYRKPDTRQLMKQLQHSLKGKRCLFVIDDLWDDNTWELIKCAFVGTPESRIITTTRKVEVAKPFDGVYMIKPLSDASSKELLHMRLFGVEARTHDSEFPSLFDKILSKCGGVPLAIIAIAGLLVKKPRHEWSKVYDSIGFGEHENAEEDIWSILSCSYYDLPYHIQKCFLSLSLFPEGQWIEKNMLIWRWVAEGLVPYGLFWRGEEYFKELTDRSMIQWAVSPRDLGQGGCRVHKIMFDLIHRLCEKEMFSSVIGTKRERIISQTSTIHRLAIHKTRVVDEDEAPKENTDTSLDVGEVMSFYASTCSGSSLPPLSEFLRLRVIDLEGCDLSDGDRKLEHLARLRELAYVGLFGTLVAELPKDIGLLKLLQTLDLTGTGIKELPWFMEELKKLRCLRAGNGTTMKGRIGQLTCLEELWLHSADKSPDFAVELRKLNQLRVLVIHFDKMDQAMGNVLVESLSDLTKLQVLQIWSDDTEEKVYFSSWGDSVPSEELRQLLLFGVILPKDTPWIHSCVCVEYLSKLMLQVETLEEVHLEILGKMPSLVSLYLHSEDGNQLSYTAGKDDGFKILEYLYTNIELVCGDGALPAIQELEVAGIRVGTDVVLSANNMPLLQKASYHLDCKDCGPEEVRQAEAALRQAGEAHPNHPTISINRFNNYGLEAHHQLIWYMKQLEALRVSGQLQANDNRLLLSNALESPAILDVLMEALAQYTATSGGPPTLVVGDAATGSPSSPSSPSPVIEISTHSGKDEELLDSWLLDIGLDPAAISNMADNFIMSPDAMLNADGSLPASEITRLNRAMIPAILSQFEKNEGVLGCPAGTSTNPMAMMMQMYLIMLQFANGAGGTQEWNNQTDEMLNAESMHQISEMISSESLQAALDLLIPKNGMPGLAVTDVPHVRNIMAKCTLNPELVECMKSLVRDEGGGAQIGSELVKLVKLVMSDYASSSTPLESGGIVADACVYLEGKHASEDTSAGIRCESLPEVTTDSMLWWLTTPDGTAFLSENAACFRISQVAFRKLVEKHVQKPEMVASLNSARRSSRDFRGIDITLMEQLIPDMVFHLIGQFWPPMPSSTPAGYTGGVISGMLSALLGNLAVGTQVAYDPTAQLSSMDDAAARSSASKVAPLSSQDADNFSRMLKELLPAVEQNLQAAASPSSKTDNVGIEQGGTD